MSDSTKNPFHKRLNSVSSQIFSSWIHFMSPIHIWREDEVKFNYFSFVKFLTEFLITRSSSDE